MDDDQIDILATATSTVIFPLLSSQRLAWEFILEELDGARQGGSSAREWAATCGIAETYYIGALNRDNSRIDGPGGPQQTLAVLCLNVNHDHGPEAMAALRTAVGKKVIEHFALDRYDPNGSNADDSATNAPRFKGGSPSYPEVNGNEFLCTDAETGHRLHVVFDGAKHTGVVEMPEQGIRMSLQSWKRGKNPFQDQHQYKGRAPDDSWFFCVDTVVPYGELLAEIESSLPPKSRWKFWT